MKSKFSLLNSFLRFAVYNLCGFICYVIAFYQSISLLYNWNLGVLMLSLLLFYNDQCRSSNYWNWLLDAGVYSFSFMYKQVFWNTWKVIYTVRK